MSRMKGSIQKRGFEKFLIRWHDPVTGKQLSKIVNGNYNLAWKELGRKRSGESEPESKPKPEVEVPKLTFGDFAAKDWKYYVSKEWRDSTQVTQGCYVRKYILPHFETKVLAEITPRDVINFNMEMQEKKVRGKNLAPNTLRIVHQILVTMLNWAVELKLIPTTPVTKKMAPKKQKIEKPSLAEEELKKLLDAIPIRYKSFLMVLALTGIRMGEALGLKWSDIDLAGREIHVRRRIWRGKEGPPKTEESNRNRPMVPQLYQSLRNHKAMAIYSKPDDYVFASASGRPLNPDQVREAMQKVLREKLNIHLGPREDGLHLLRHTSGSLIYWETCDMKAAQAWLGHAAIETTMNTYVHQMKGHEERSAERLAQALFAQPEASSGVTN